MKPKTLEDFHDSVIGLYKDMIHEALLESEMEARSHLDEDLLNTKIREIVSSARFDGLSEKEVTLLIEEAKKEWISHHTPAKAG